MINGDDETEKACFEAFKCGYRHIDTAHAYQNERGVGSAIKKSGLKREEVWITSKLWPNEYGEGKTAAAIDKMLGRLQMDYSDLLLLHQQFGDYIGVSFANSTTCKLEFVANANLPIDLICFGILK